MKAKHPYMQTNTIKIKYCQRRPTILNVYHFHLLTANLSVKLRQIKDTLN